MVCNFEKAIGLSNNYFNNSNKKIKSSIDNSQLKAELMPKDFSEFVGQERVKSILTDVIKSSTIRKEPLPHMLFNANPGYGKCVRNDTLVLSQNGMCRIDTFKKKTNLKSYKINESIYGIGKFNKSNLFYLNGISDTIKITSSNGMFIEGTKNHPILILNNNKLIWKELQNININDTVAIGIGQNIFGNKNIIDKFNFTKDSKMNNHCYDNVKIPKVWTPELARLCGYLIGDGSIGSKTNNDLSFVQVNNFILEDFKYCIKKCFGNIHINIIKDKRNLKIVTIRFGNEKIKKFLKHIGMSMVTSRYKTTPNIMKCSKDIIINFIKAYGSCDGYLCKNTRYIEFSSSSYNLLHELQIILLNLGIMSSIRNKYIKFYNQTYYMLKIYGKYVILYLDLIGFMQGKKNITENNYIFLNKIKSNPNTDVIVGGRNYLVYIKKLIKQLHQYMARNNIQHCSKNISRDKFYLIYNEIYNQIDCILKDLKNNAISKNLTFDKVKLIENSKSETMDFVIPEEHLFFGNGFINHNTTIAYLIAKETGRKLISIVGSMLSNVSDVYNIFNSIKKDINPIIFVDEIHSVDKKVAELFYQPMEIPNTEILLPNNYGTMNISIKVPALTIIGATTQEGLLEKPFFDRFSLRLVFDKYTIENMCDIGSQSADKLNLKLSKDIVKCIADRSCYTPRILDNLLYRIRDFSVSRGIKNITKKNIDELFNQLDIDKLGLDSIARKILVALAKNPRGCLGFKSLSVASSVDEQTLKRVYEPQLLLNDLISFLPKGRAITEQGLNHITGGRYQQEGNTDNDTL